MISWCKLIIPSITGLAGSWNLNCHGAVAGRFSGLPGAKGKGKEAGQEEENESGSDSESDSEGSEGGSDDDDDDDDDGVRTQRKTNWTKRPLTNEERKTGRRDSKEKVGGASQRETKRVEVRTRKEGERIVWVKQEKGRGPRDKSMEGITRCLGRRTKEP